MPRVPRTGLFWLHFGALLCILSAVCAILQQMPSLPQAGALAAFAAICALLAARFVQVKIITLTGAVERLAHGELSARGEELEAERHQAQAILESMGEGVIALDRDARVLWLNAAAQRLLDLQRQPDPGTSLLGILRQPELEEMVRDVLRSRMPAARELYTFGGQARTIRFQVVPCEGGERGAALVVVAQDVTETRRLEHLRREFVANVSHELKTPLTTIKSAVETLVSGALDDPAHSRRFVAMIEQDARRLGQLIDDLLELSQIESKATVLQREAVDLRALFESLLPIFGTAARERQVQMELAISAGVPQVLGDPERLRQIFLNLLDNAIKYNKPGGRVTISAQPRADRVAVQITDTGIGIPEQDVPRIFERFYRVDKARSRALGGTGLGLSIVKHLVELHQGSVEVASRLGEGSTFTVLLPRL